MFAYYYASAKPETLKITGEVFVENEVPPPGIFPLFLKPVTILCVLIIISWYSFIELLRRRIYSLRPISKSVVKLILLLTAIISLYELLFNFMLWMLIISQQDGSTINPDRAVNVFPTDRYPINMVFATKIAVVIFGCSIYTIATFWNVGKKNMDLTDDASLNS